MLRYFWKRRGLILRILFCWALGITFLFFDEVKQYDLRFQMRGPQPVTQQIVLVYLDQDDWTAYNGQNSNLLRVLKEFSINTDSLFWSPSTWNSLLTKILASNPKVVGVTFFFRPGLRKPPDSLRALTDNRVIWASQLDSEGRPQLPITASSLGNNVALVGFRVDEDQILRRFTAPLAPLSHMGMQLAESAGVTSTQEMNDLMGETRLINYRGGKGSFPTISGFDVLRGEFQPDFFKNKIVIIGTHSVPSHLYQTPLGQMTRAQILANVADNVIGRRWIARLSFPLCVFYILAVILAAIWILTTYPQTIAFVFLIWLALGTTALSLWVFDWFYFWIPAFSPLISVLVTYVVLLGYQLSRKENQAWRLEQEKRLLGELDQLRNNFVSLISHDLKTPIAKIQAICDRLLSGAIPDEVKDGLGNLRKESVELHRYIQSILQVSRLEARQVQVRKEPTDLNELVERAMAQLRPLMEDKRQTVDLQLEPLFSLEVDTVMIQEVVVNLIENAIKYTPNDGHIEVRTQEIDDKVIFSVKDNGPGISRDDQEHIFEKFFRGQAEKSTIKGTGMGLYLVKYFIELHGGEVFLESEVGKGTRVGFTIPLV